MKPVDEILEAIKNKFPRQDGRIDQLFEDDMDFRTLCTDYFTCIQSLLRFRKLSSEGSQSIKDFETAINDLEKELYDFIFP